MHKDAKEAKANAEKAWKGAGTKVGIQVWRIEKFKVAHVPENSYGSFYAGDSYIILHTKLEGDSKKFTFDLFFWQGAESTQDEKGAVAFKAVELDDYLGGDPVQHRECMGHESTKFLKLWGQGINIMQGGIDSGFNKVGPKEYKPRLLHFTGKKVIRVIEVAKERASLNQGDVFLLDMGLELIQWNGPASNAREKRKAMEYIVSMKDKRLGRAASRVIDGMEEDPVFWEQIGGMGPIAEPTPDVCAKKLPAKLFQVSDASGSMTVQEVGEGKSITRDKLDQDDVFLLDTGTETAGIFIWIGSGANKSEKRQAFSYVDKYLETHGRPAWTAVSRLSSSQETAAFKKWVF